MTSLIFGSIYLGHHAIVNHRREKQRLKNYERWEDLRDDYDAQKKTQRETRSLDLQRTGSGIYPQYTGYENGNAGPQGQEEQKAILTLRDQQEANDARTGWRPQESWDSHPQMVTAQNTGMQWAQAESLGRRSLDLRPVSSPVSPHVAGPVYGQPTGLGLKPQKTGAVWDEGLPAPLRVSRMTYDGGETSRPGSGYSTPNPARTPSGSTGSQPVPSTLGPGRSATASASNLNLDLGFSGGERNGYAASGGGVTETQVPGGKMAELIEGGGLKTPAGEKDMVEWWK